ncbi:class I SAM-dependent methyltransferase [Candidatus Micrarchaeota archaeon]|nr:class I SAM-dependent methyltransferase [Candidatus Micrarchaeota archaeon]
MAGNFEIDENRRMWTHRRLYDRDLPPSYATLLSSPSNRLKVSRFLRVPGLKNGDVRGLEIGAGYNPMLAGRKFGHTVFLDISRNLLKFLREGIANTKNKAVGEYLRQDWLDATSFSRVKGKDGLPLALAKLRDKYARHKPPREKFSYVQADARNLPFSGSFHIAFLPEVLTHIEPEKRLETLRKIADAISHRLVVIDLPASRQYPAHVASDPAEFAALLEEKGFKVRVRQFPGEEVGDRFMLVADRMPGPPAAGKYSKSH